MININGLIHLKNLILSKKKSLSWIRRGLLCISYSAFANSSAAFLAASDVLVWGRRMGSRKGNVFISYLPTSYIASHGLYVDPITHIVKWK